MEDFKHSPTEGRYRGIEVSAANLDAQKRRASRSHAPARIRLPCQELCRHSDGRAVEFKPVNFEIRSTFNNTPPVALITKA
jgi:hypothetical protein